MRLRNVKNAQEKLRASAYFIEDPLKWRGKWHQVFNANKPLHLEIGTGKGQFLIAMAKENPDILFIGVEKYESVLVRAIEKVELENLPNIRFICGDAFKLNAIFAHEITTIYLNFSDPWPKSRHAKRRLTSPSVLAVYEELFISTKTIIQKTDNPDFFTYSIESLSQYGYVLEQVSLHLENSNIKNVETEYEQKFKNLGYPIYYLKAVKK